MHLSEYLVKRIMILKDKFLNITSLFVLISLKYYIHWLFYIFCIHFLYRVMNNSFCTTEYKKKNLCNYLFLFSVYFIAFFHYIFNTLVNKYQNKSNTWFVYKTFIIFMSPTPQKCFLQINEFISANLNYSQWKLLPRINTFNISLYLCHDRSPSYFVKIYYHK